MLYLRITFSLESVWEERGLPDVARLPSFQMVFFERYLSVGCPLPRTCFSDISNISCGGAEMRDGLSRSRAEGLVQQLELWWLSENQQGQKGQWDYSYFRNYQVAIREGETPSGSSDKDL